jgi:hypothetical protein
MNTQCVCVRACVRVPTTNLRLKTFTERHSMLAYFTYIGNQEDYITHKKIDF